MISSRLDVDVGRRAAHAAHGLMQQETRVRQAKPPLFRAGKEDERAGAGDPAGADHPHRRDRIDEADHVVDGVAALDMAAGRVDVNVDRFVGVARQCQQPPGDVAGNLVVDRAEHEHLARVEQPRFELIDRRRQRLVVVGLLRLRALRLGDFGVFVVGAGRIAVGVCQGKLLGWMRLI